MTLGSLFSGSGGFELAGALNGITPVWSSEIEAFPLKVTAARFPKVKQLGDVTKINGAAIEPVDIITFGSPCQDLSVAGKQAGIHEGQRSNLFFEAVRIIREMREHDENNGRTDKHVRPRFAVWENVPGAFSSNKGADFKAVLDALCQVRDADADVPQPKKWGDAGCIVGDGYSVAWRVYDAQYWGVPQRRKRIYLVADFAGERAGEILFEREGVREDSAESGAAREGTAADAERGAGTAGGVCLNDQGGDRMDVSEDVAGTLRAQDHGHPPVVMATGFCTEHSAASRSIGYEDETSPTLRAGVVPAAIALEHHPADCRIRIDGGDAIQTLTSRMGTGGNNVPLIMAPEGPLVPYTLKIRCGKEGGGKGPLVQEDKSATLATNNDQTLFAPSAFGISSDQSHAMLSDNPHAGIYEAKTSRTLDLNGGHPGCNQGGIAVVEKAYPLEGNGQRPSHQGDGWNESDAMYTLNATEHHGVAAPVYHGTKNSHLTHFTDDPALDTLVATEYKEPPVVSAEPYYIVRRLTPTECCRLQGFPDWWDADVDGSDSARYKMWGNGIALPCAADVLRRIAEFVGKEGER